MGKYYVYKCFVDNKLRYVGKGKGNRYKHTISGRSTCAKLNKAFFDGKEIKVKIFKWGLTEEQAFFEESTLINLNANSLWNLTKGGISLKETIKNDADAKYKITSPEGEEFFINSYKAFCKRHNRSHTNFAEVLSGRQKYAFGGWTIVRLKGVKKQNKYKFTITSPDGVEFVVDSYRTFAKERGINAHSFKKVLQGKQSTCYGGYRITREVIR